MEDFISPLTPAALVPDSELPRSQQYQDVYFNPSAPIAESQFVFIENTQLNERFHKSRGPYRILETGFGTGLNFLLACRTFLSTQASFSPSAQSHLHFVSVEKHPLPHATFTAQVDRFLREPTLKTPSLADIGQRLTQQYPPLIPGTYRLVWPEHRITLTLLWQDALEALKHFSGTIDTFFLDGFAPSKNPDLWSEAVFLQLARVANPEANFATFTSAGHVRRGLASVGFSVAKRPGFQHKREMLVGKISKTDATPPLFKTPLKQAPKITIVGAGISGCATAHRLATAGYYVTLIDTAPQVAAKASGNSKAALQTPLTLFKSTFNEFQHSSAYFSTSNIHALAPTQVPLATTGVIQLPGNPREKKRFAKIQQHKLWPDDWEQIVDAESASHIANTQIDSSGLYYPRALLIPAAELCQALAQHPNIELILNRSFSLTANTEALESSTLKNSDITILCTAFHTQQLLPEMALHLKPIRGQITELPCTPESAALTTILSGKNYLLPKTSPQETSQILGATYHLNNSDDTYLPEENTENLAKLYDLSPKIARAYAQIDPTTLQGRAAVRTQSRDYLPLVGPIEPLGFKGGLLVNCGLGSRGFTHAWICADILLSYLEGTPFAISESLRKAIHPERFQLKTKH